MAQFRNGLFQARGILLFPRAEREDFPQNREKEAFWVPETRNDNEVWGLIKKLFKKDEGFTAGFAPGGWDRADRAQVLAPDGIVKIFLISFYIISLLLSRVDGKLMFQHLSRAGGNWIEEDCQLVESAEGFPPRRGHRTRSASPKIQREDGERRAFQTSALDDCVVRSYFVRDDTKLLSRFPGSETAKKKEEISIIIFQHLPGKRKSLIHIRGMESGEGGGGEKKSGVSTTLYGKEKNA